MNRLRATEARSVLQEELERVNWETDSAFTVGDGDRPNSSEINWWHKGTPENERSDTIRNLGYLRAYLRISGIQVLDAGGLFLYRRRLWMDRSVISRLERDGYLKFEQVPRPNFVLTKKGQEFVEQNGWQLSNNQKA